MLDQQKWRKAFLTASKAEISAGRLNRAALAVHFAELKDENARVSKQAVYEWFRTGRISDDSLNEMARFLGCDPVALRIRGTFEKARPAGPEAPVDDDAILDLIRSRAASLDPAIRKQFLGLLETMCALANPKAYNHEAEAHRKALAARRPAKEAK